MRRKNDIKNQPIRIKNNLMNPFGENRYFVSKDEYLILGTILY